MISSHGVPNPPTKLVADVTIVGAGPVGLLLANFLGARGVRTLIFDKRTAPQTSSMAIGITPPSLEIMKKLGLDVVFRDAGVPVRHAEVHEDRTCLGRIDFAGIPSEYPYFLSLPQARTIEILRESLIRYPGVKVHDGVEFSGLSNDAVGVQATFRDPATGALTETQASFLIGADGHKSAVRSAVGLTAREKIYPQRFIMADFPDDSGLGSEARLFFTAEASVESFPLPRGLRRWIVQVGAAGNEVPVDYLISKVRRLTGYDLGGKPARSVGTFGAKRMTASCYYAGRVLLAGDAAHVMSSIGGQGMNTGFADAEMLGEMLPLVLKQPERMARCFPAYDRVRRRAYEVAASRAERGMWLGTKRGRLASWCRKRFIKHVLFSAVMQPRLAPHFAMLTIPHRNLNWVSRDWLTTD